MRVSNLHPKGEGRDDGHDGEPAPAELKEQQQLRERQELIHALRNFAEHFGSAEVYQQARLIHLESPAGRAEVEKEKSDSFGSILRGAGRSDAPNQAGSALGKKVRRGSPALEDAKRALGG